MKDDFPKIVILYQELYRQTLHSAVALFIIPLRWLNFWYGIIFAIIAFFWNLWLMPRWFKDSFREKEKETGYSKGMLSYSVCILVLAILFPLPMVASGWAVLSLADGLATLFGRVFGKKTLPWNKNKTWLGSMVFFISASVFGWLAFLWTLPNLNASSIISLNLLSNYLNLASLSQILSQNIFLIFTSSLIAGLISAITESLATPYLDDNLTAPLAYALTISILIFSF